MKIRNDGMFRVFLPCIFIACILACAGCGSSLARHARNSGGLAGFLLDKPGNNLPIAIEKISSGGGEITSAHIKSYGRKIYVTGVVRRRISGSLPPGAHVDVIVVDKSKKVVEGVAVNYLPRDIPYGTLGRTPQSQYMARLGSMPANGSTVKVILHVPGKSGCEFGENHDPSQTAHCHLVRKTSGAYKDGVHVPPTSQAPLYTMPPSSEPES